MQLVWGGHMLCAFCLPGQPGGIETHCTVKLYSDGTVELYIGPTTCEGLTQVGSGLQVMLVGGGVAEA